MISSGEISKLKINIQKFDKIVCALGSEIGDLAKI